MCVHPKQGMNNLAVWERHGQAKGCTVCTCQGGKWGSSMTSNGFG